jgi:hypothetical protein
MRQERAMGAIYISWAISGVVLLGFAVVLGLAANSRIDGILIDERGRYSLTHFQLCLWTITVLSLLSGVFFGRLVHGVTNPLNIVIPDQVLLLLGIVLGSAVTATGVKRAKDVIRPGNVAVSGGSDLATAPKLMQMFLVEEGASANEAVDITKFQGFVITILLVISYISVTVNAISAAGTAQNMTSLPGFNGKAVLILLGISQGAYVAGKIPNSAGEPSPSVWDRSSDPRSLRVLNRAASRPPRARPAPVEDPGGTPTEHPSEVSEAVRG